MNLSSIQFVTHAGAIHDVEVGCAGAEPPVSQGSNVVHICLSKPWSVHQNQSPALGSFPQDWDVSVEDVAFAVVLSSIPHASLGIKDEFHSTIIQLCCINMHKACTFLLWSETLHTTLPDATADFLYVNFRLYYQLHLPPFFSRYL